MNRIYQQVLFVLSLTLFFILATPPHRAIAQQPADNGVSVSYNDFYQDLSNYGQWVEDPQYGYVWSPNVDGTFRPYYTNGYWAMTDYGNTWISYYPWGWACFHYGRWTYDNYYGWLWIPGQNWGPAWVSWRYGEGYYGWAPLGPSYQFGASYGDYYCPNDWWVFIPPQYIYSGNYYHYWYGPRGNSHHVKNSTVVNNTYVTNDVTYVAGPRQKEIEDITHQPIQVFRLANSKSRTAKVKDNVVKIYHPLEIKQAASIDGQRASPPNVVSAPQPVRTQQPVKTGGEATTTPFRNNLPKNNGRIDPPGANVNEIATPAPAQPKYDNNPYEYDVNRPVPQPRQEQSQPVAPRQQQPQPRSQPQAQPQPQNTYRPPAQQPQSTPRPAPAQPARESGKR